MTEKLFYKDPYQTTTTAIVIKKKEQNEGYWVTFDKAIFYPEGGGQPCDLGTVNGLELKKVVTEDNEIWHLLPKALSVDEVECKLNWPRRFDHMQQHGGQHILSAVADKLFNATTVGFRLSEHYTTVDLRIPKLTSLQIEQLENEANRIVFNNLRIYTYFADQIKLKGLKLRKKPQVNTDVRIVEVDKYDYSPCCGTHPQWTGEIGLIKILKAEKIRGDTRLYIVCGYRALAKFAFHSSIINKLIDLTSSNEHNLFDAIIKIHESDKEKHKEINTLKDQLLSYQAIELIRNRAQKNNKAIIKHITDILSGSELKKLLNQIIKKSPDTIVLLASSKESTVKLAVYNSTNPSINVGIIFKKVLANYDGKGGGNIISAQGSCRSIADADSILNELDQIFRS